ncbi:MAG: peptidylprolyl isomerase [Acidobacteriota bacterium]|nr:peptidylprolyl isomerase [Acidobacteriota bacterium]
MKITVLALTASLSMLAQAPPAKHPAASTTRRPTSAAARKPAAGKASLMNPSSLNAQAPALFKVKFTTTKGDFVIEVHRDWAPLGADRFFNLVKNGFYDDATFFRVLPGFMAQFGINAKPAVSKVWEPATIKDDPPTQSNKRGYVSYATSGPNTRTTQMFINYGDNSRLDGQGFSAFGMVTEGMDVVDKLYSGYGEGAPGGSGPDQGRIQHEGKAYLDKDFPQLDSIKTARITEPAGIAAPVKPPVKAAPKPGVRKPVTKPAAPAHQ